jgi:FlaG/FlaF family flagellin (archaellin)
MNEQDLIKLWINMRSQIIFAQVAPTLVLVAVFVTAAFGKFDTASDATKYLVLGSTAATGVLAMISQYAAVREGESVLKDLAKVNSKSGMGAKLSQSSQLLSLAAISIIGFGFLTFALVTWTVLG